jgi:cell division protein FtsB
MTTSGGTVIDEPLNVVDDRAAVEAVRRRRRRVRIGTWLGLMSVLVAGLVLLALLPVRSWMSQRAQIRDAEKRLADIQTVNDRLQRRVNALSTPAEVDRVARGQFSLVKPGEAPYSLLPAPTIDIESLPAQWPYTLLQQFVAARR